MPKSLSTPKQSPPSEAFSAVLKSVWKPAAKATRNTLMTTNQRPTSSTMPTTMRTMGPNWSKVESSLRPCDVTMRMRPRESSGSENSIEQIPSGSIEQIDIPT
eukprot:2303806-Prymnesium_polylepis.3